MANAFITFAPVFALLGLILFVNSSILKPENGFALKGGGVDMDEDEEERELKEAKLRIHLNQFCFWVDESLESLHCQGLKWLEDFPTIRSREVEELTLSNITSGGNLNIKSLGETFPSLLSLSIVKSPGSWNLLFPSTSKSRGGWTSIRELSLAQNDMSSEELPQNLMKIFPKLEVLNLRDNKLVILANIPVNEWKKLKKVDLSGNPLDCTTDFDWIEREDLELLNKEKTKCDKPSHQNKPKPILETMKLIKEVRDECQLNCSCVIVYIWEQEKTIRSKVSVNCSNRGFLNFPDPTKLPRHTDILDLGRNMIKGLDKFVEDTRYLSLNIKDLYLDNNQISSINILESSQWFYNFQILSLRNNKLTEVPIYLLDNTLQQNKRIYFIDISKNNWDCDCRTVTTFKVWLLKYSENIRNIDEVRCADTNEQIRYLKDTEWCRKENGEELIDFLDTMSIIFAILIFLIICKVYYDYTQYKKTGHLPFLSTKLQFRSFTHKYEFESNSNR